MYGGDHHYKILKSGVMDMMLNITDRSIPAIAKSLYNTSEIAHNIEDICNQMEQGIREGYRVEYCNNSVFWLSPIPYENIDWGC